MKKIWELIRKLFRRSQPTKPGLSPPTPKTVGTQPTGVVKPVPDISTSSSNDSPTKEKPENDGSKEGFQGSGDIKPDNENPTSPQHTENKDKNSTVSPTEPNNKYLDKKPRNIGSKRGEKITSPKPKPRQGFVPKPELICREEERVFNIILDIPSHYKVKCIEQNETPLQSELNNEYIITDLSQPVTLTTTDGRTEKFPLLEEKYMIFKTRNNWEGTGRHIKTLTQGFFVVITPNTWCRESPASVEPARCSDEQYLVHFFQIDSSDELEGVRFFNECGRPPLRRKLLEGIVIQDDSTRGNLFGQRPPTLNIPSPEEVLWIRIGEEGQENSNPWSYNFKPAEKNLEDILKSRYGHFFLRAYDKDTQLIDSIEFRYYGDLSKIQIDGQSYNPKKPLPPPRDGYKATRLEFIGTNDQSLLKGKIDPSKMGDTDWNLESESGKGKVKVVINLPRIRWKLCPVDNEQWSDKSIIMTRERFQHLSQSGTKLKLQVPLYIKKVTTGFNEPLKQTVSTKEGISLASFVDHQEINLPQSYPSHLQFAWSDITVTAITIQSDKSTNQPTSRYLEPRIRPIVTSNRGLSRQGRGFSRGELELADVDITGNVPNIYIDRRRKTVHQTNVEALEGIYRCRR